MKARINQWMTAALAAAAFSLYAVPMTVQAQAPGSAEGDSYAAFGQVFLVSGGPITAGPIAPARATVAPGTTQSAGSGLVNYTSCVQGAAGCASFQQPVIDSINVPGDTAKATLAASPTTGCNPTGVNSPPNFNNGALTGASACAHVAQAGALNSAKTGAATDLVAAEGVDAQSTTQSCTATPEGVVNIAHLAVGGVDVVGGTGAVAAGSIKPNTTLNLAAATVILNEQVYDSHGHGLTVNAIHVFTNSSLLPALLGTSADVIIAHAHTQAMCSDTATTDTAGLNAAPKAGANVLSMGSHCTPSVVILDSTKHANPGEDVAYTLRIDNSGCGVTSVTDVLPPGFHFVSASGDLGNPTLGTAGGQDQLFWAPAGKAYPLSPNPMVEVINAHIDANASTGQAVDTAYGTSDGGSFAGSDVLGLRSSAVANNGDNPGIILPRDSGVNAANNGANLGAGNNGGQLPVSAVNGNLPYTSTAADGRLAVMLLLVGLSLCSVAGLAWFRRSARKE